MSTSPVEADNENAPLASVANDLFAVLLVIVAHATGRLLAEITFPVMVR
jgi:hypothetical protein